MTYFWITKKNAAVTRWESKTQRSSSRLASQQGFSLIEMIATIALLGILVAMATGGLTYYFSVKSLDTSAKELTTQIREAQAMAVSTGNTYRINFGQPDMGTYILQSLQDSGWVDVRGPINLEGGVNFAAASSLEFYSRGTCSGAACDGGQLLLQERFGSNKTIQVDGETVNVRVS